MQGHSTPTTIQRGRSLWKRVSARMNETAGAGVARGGSASEEKDRAASKQLSDESPLHADARGGHEAFGEELSHVAQEPSQIRQQPGLSSTQGGGEQEDHDEESPSVLARNGGDPPTARDDPPTAQGGNTPNNAATRPSARDSVGPFRVFPEERRVEHVGRSLRNEDALRSTPAAQNVSQGNNHDHDTETGLMNDTDDAVDATVIPMLQASLVDDRIVEAHPIHLTHVPISSMQQHFGSNWENEIQSRSGENVAENDGSKSRMKKVFNQHKRPIYWGLLICVAVAVAVGGYFIGTKDKTNGNSSESGSYFSVNGTLGGPQSEGEEISSTTGEDEEKVEPGRPESLFASQGNETNTTAFAEKVEPGPESLFVIQDNETNTTAFAPTEANDVSPLIWEQVGSSIPGIIMTDRAGFSVASSNDGKIIAIDSPWNSDVARDAGHVRIFAWNNSANDWVQRGSTLLGEMEEDRFGHSLAMSGSGDTVACGAPYHDRDNQGQVKVFKWNETLADYVAWGSLHNHGRFWQEQWGYDVALSEDGLRVALGAPKPDTYEGFGGFARVFEWNATIMDWSLMGHWEYKGNGLMDSEQLGDNFGHSISLSADGETLAVSAMKHNGTSGEPDVGKVHVLKWDYGVSDWVQLGSRIYGEAAGDESGWSTDLSADGKIIAISSRMNDGEKGEESGHVRVYFWDEIISDWAQMGSDIDGADQFDRFGLDIRLSDDGRTIAITSLLNLDNGLNSGHCRVFQWSDSLQDWIQVGRDIQGEAGDRTRGVALSGDGRTVIVGTLANSVRVFKSSLPLSD